MAAAGPTGDLGPEMRLGALLAELRRTTAGSASRRELVLELSCLLTANAADARVAAAFIDAEGPRIVYEMESCMSGNWMVDARNGTMGRLSELARMAGPIGVAISAHRNQSDFEVEAAAHAGHGHSHGDGHGHGHGH